MGELALGQQGVGGDGLAGDVEGFQERDDHPDLVGLLDLVAAVYGQGADFFWVWQVWLLVADDAEDVGLAAVVVDGVAHRLAVDGQRLVVGVLEVPALQGAVQGVGVDADEHLADDGAAGDLVATVAVAAAKARPRLLAQVLRPTG